MMIGDQKSESLAWYDNEWGYSNRVVDLVKFVAIRVEKNRSSNYQLIVEKNELLNFLAAVFNVANPIYFKLQFLVANKQLNSKFKHYIGNLSYIFLQ